MEAELVPARMLNEWVYCPRLAWLEWVDGEWADSAETVDGRFVHNRVDREHAADVPGPAEMPAEDEVLGHGWLLSAPDEHLTAKMDLVECVGGKARPVDYKRGRVPDRGPWDPERVQVCAHALVLRAAGYECDEAVLYFAGSRRRVTVVVDDALVAKTRAAVGALREAVEGGRRPAPLVDSPKCLGCSLAGICLPDEVNALAAQVVEDVPEPRRLYAARDDALPLHVVKQGAQVGLSGEELKISHRGQELARARIPGTASVSLYGGVSITTGALRTLMGRGIPVAWFSTGGWFYGQVGGLERHGLELRRAQYRAADAPHALALARRFVRAKLGNQRTLLRRNHAAVPSMALRALTSARRRLERAPGFNEILGCEGEGASTYFQNFEGMLKRAGGIEAFRWSRRSRRPPEDPTNAALSFAYALLTRLCHSTLQRVGFDPMLGFLHQPRAGRPALALDFMEEFRPVLADSAVLMAFNNGELRPGHFLQRGPACALTADGRRILIGAWERRLDGLVTHPVFGYRLSYRRVLEVQARLLARHLLGELDDYPEFLVR